jgi:serine/threonine protein phosphatase PrpC
MEILGILNSKYFDFSLKKSQVFLTQRIKDIFEMVDEEYFLLKLNQVKEGKVVDDGCTMIVNIIQTGYCLNINLGDSRTLLATRNQNHWIYQYQSTDHSMSHSKIQEIVNRGGRLVWRGMILDPVHKDKIPQSRIYRPVTNEIKAIGISHRKTLNLSATLGDVLFKVKPAVMSPVPDITFYKIEKETLIVMATDGVWDHIYTDSVHLQGQLICDYISNWWSTNTMDMICEQLVDREAWELYASATRYDDASMVLIHIE